MYRKILLAYDGTREGRAVLREGADLAGACGAEAVLLAVIDIAAGFVLAEAAATDGLPEAEEAEARAILDEGLARLRQRGIAAEGRLAAGDPEQAILAAALDLRVDLIVIGHHRRRSWFHWRAGSVGQRLLAEAPCSLLVAVDRAQPGD